MNKMIILVIMAFVMNANILHSQVAVESLKFGTAVEKNDIVGEGTSFPAETEKVFCWMRITGAQGKTVMMKWYRDNVFLSDVALEIISNNMRTYAYKSIFGNGGAYKVEVVDDGGNVLQTGEFTITGGTTAAAATTEAAGSDGAISIEALKFGTGVEKSEVIGEAASFPASTEKVYCWLKVIGGNEKTVTIKWYYKDAFMSDVALDIKSNSMRTYAYKTIAGNQGEWRVEVVGPSGAVLQAASFTVN